MRTINVKNSNALAAAPFGSSFDLKDTTTTTTTTTNEKEEDYDDKDNFNNSIDHELKRKLKKSEKLIVLIVISIITASYVVAFSASLGYGRETFRFLASDEDQYEIELISLSVFLFLIFFVFDASYWESAFFKRTRTIGLTIATAMFVASAILSAKAYPQAPPTMFVVVAPIFLVLLKKVLERKRTNDDDDDDDDGIVAVRADAFLMTCAFALLSSAVGIAVWFACVVRFGSSDANNTALYWSEELKRSYMADAGCKSAAIIAVSEKETGSSDDVCLAAYIMWFTPMLAILACILFSVFCYVLGLAVQEEEKEDEKDITKKKSFTTRAFTFAFALAALGIWIAASLSGGAEELSALLLSFSMAAIFVLGCSTVFALGGAEKAKQKALNSSSLLRATNKAVTGTHADVFRAIMLSTPMTLLIPVFLTISAINQFVRRYISKTAKSMDEKLHRGFFTFRVGKFLEECSQWRWSAIMINTHYWIALLVSLNVLAGTFTVVFLSWLRLKLATAGFAFTYVVFSLVGLAMFLIPVIPGIPVYLTGGILLTDETSVNFFKAQLGENSETKAYACAILAASGACFFVKLLAVVMQQKLIGERLGTRVWVRSTVGVNSVAMRATKIALSKRGFSRAKVAILVGGPDWPTSVLTGILNLNVFEMLLGTVPVIIPVITTVLAGAFMLKQGTNSLCGGLRSSLVNETATTSDKTSGLWNSIADVALLVTAVVQGTCLLLGIYYVEQTASNCKEELENLPYDEEVLLIDEEMKRAREIREGVSKFSTLKPSDQTLLLFSTTICLLSFWVIQLGATFIGNDEAVLKEYQLTDCVSATLKGQVWTVVTDIGWLAILLFICSMFTLWTFNARIWAHVQDVILRENLIENGEEEEEEEEDEEEDEAEAEEDDEEEEDEDEKFKRNFSILVKSATDDEILTIKHSIQEQSLPKDWCLEKLEESK